MLRWKVDHLPRSIITAMDWVAGELAGLGLSHNDLVPRNILINMSTEVISSIVDWDLCGLACIGGEYARAVSDHNDYGDSIPGIEDYFHVLLRHSFNRTGEELVLGYSEELPAR
ncbi:hypothetical protein D9757_004960 [Collybiopsis confluens]|uniref:Aminoglycoside phosphotransferase domain-containing protein n=1 Tax=Collybiopsis confluens TaxID=2823264 RepID=A0A8H5MCQ4_9AGAR|nr:hypothetical protein D9757_004960 [Collybiopsis confluens]